mmetsp:Transcript_10489/g.18945  ORF Transcript_10489/g.18945 Transcript_10489/m.18945 type:complete len:730 (-) Transcript_10489:135-2324(-)
MVSPAEIDNKEANDGNSNSKTEDADAEGVPDNHDGVSAVVAAAVATEEGGGNVDDDGGAAGGDEDEAKVNDNNDDDEGPPAKRARTAVAVDAAAQELDDEDETPIGPNLDVQQAVLKYKRKKGTTYDFIYVEEEESGQGGKNNFGIKLAAVKVRNAHSFLTHFYQAALGDKYRGRPPTASDQAIIVESILDTAPATVKTSVQRNDVLLFIDEKLVNITDKKRLKYYKSRLNNGARPLKLTFFRPSEGVEEPDEEETELDPSEALYVTKYEPPEIQTPISKPKAASANSTKADRQARRALLERRMEELELLHVETSTELSELRTYDGILDGKSKEGEGKLSVKGDEDFAIPSHIMYYPPMKLRRKKLPALNEACNKVENLLRQRMMIDNEADKIRAVVEQSQRRLNLKDKELEALDKQIAPALEQLKFIEMEVQDNWKTMFLKLKDYHEENGHSNVPEKENNKLAKWITRQRTCYANAQLEEPNPSMGIIKPYQYELLNQIEFCWNPREQQFIQNVTTLRAYKKEHGHTNVPMKYENIHLANFVQKWRREYRLFQEGKPSNMSKDRLQVLEGAGFTWRDPSRTRKRSDTRQETWDGFISQLEEFKEKYGHFMVNKINKTLEKGNRLGRLDEFCGWVRKQYTLYKEGSPCQLTDEKVNQLKEMEFWLERGQSHRLSASKKEKEEAIAQLGELQVPIIHRAADNKGKTDESATAEGEGGDEAMLDAANTAMV